MQLTRRRFVELGVGALTLLPAVAGGFLVPGPRGRAYADDELGDYRIVVVSPTQVGILVSDQANDANTPVPGVSVTLKSRYNGKTLTGTTDQGGIVLFDILDLSEPELEYGWCVFNGTIDITAEGYREFYMGIARIKGGLALSVPTRTHDSSLSYPSRVSFAEWDMLYSISEFVSAKGNTASNEILVEIRDLPKPATLTLHDRSSSKVYATAQLSPSNGVATTSMKYPYLQRGSEDALPVNGKFYMQMDDGSTICEFPVALGVRPGVADAFTLAPEKDYVPANNRVPSGETIIIPDYVPGIGNQSLMPMLPIGNVVFVVDPFGYLYIAWATPRIGYIKDDSTPNPGEWGKHPYTSASQQYNSFFDSAMDKALNIREKIAQGANLTQFSFTPKLESTISLRFLAMAQWNWESGYCSGEAQFQALLHFGVGFCEQFAVGPIPFFIDFMFNADIVYQFVGLGFATPDGLDITKYDWGYTNTGASGTVNMSPTLSVGIGICGLASIGIRSTLLLSLFTGYSIKPDP